MFYFSGSENDRLKGTEGVTYNNIQINLMGCKTMAWYSLDIMNNDIATIFSRMENPLFVLLFPPDRLFRMIHLIAILWCTIESPNSRTTLPKLLFSKEDCVLC